MGQWCNGQTVAPRHQVWVIGHDEDDGMQCARASRDPFDSCAHHFELYTSLRNGVVLLSNILPVETSQSDMRPALRAKDCATACELSCAAPSAARHPPGLAGP